MATIATAGLINIETTLKVDSFPVTYNPARFPFFGVNSSVSGVGYNVSKALTTLGHDVRFMALVGRDDGAVLVRADLDRINVDGAYVRDDLDKTPQSVILYDGEGRRAIFTDLKDIQDRDYPPDAAESALAGVSLAVLCNINFARPMLARARALNIPIATDVHAIAAIDDAYNRDYMAAATILFQSHEKLPCAPEEWIHELWARYRTPIAVVGMGADGALLGLWKEGSIQHIPAVTTRPVVSTIGAGDALFSAFIHTYIAAPDPALALRKAAVFASYKIGVAGAADGFLASAALDALYEQTR